MPEIYNYHFMWYYHILHYSETSYSHMPSSGILHKGTTVTFSLYQISSLKLYLFSDQIVAVRIFISFKLGKRYWFEEKLVCLCGFILYQLISYLICPSHCL